VYGSATLTNCTVSGNWAAWTGGGLCCRGSSTTLTSCILWGNAGGSVTFDESSEPQVTYSFITPENQSQNPLFVPASATPMERLTAADPRLLSRDPSDRIDKARLLQLSLGNRIFGSAKPGRPAHKPFRDAQLIVQALVHLRVQDQKTASACL